MGSEGGWGGGGDTSCPSTMSGSPDASHTPITAEQAKKPGTGVFMPMVGRSGRSKPSRRRNVSTSCLETPAWSRQPLPTLQQHGPVQHTTSNDPGPPQLAQQHSNPTGLLSVSVPQQGPLLACAGATPSPGNHSMLGHPAPVLLHRTASDACSAVPAAMASSSGAQLLYPAPAVPAPQHAVLTVNHQQQQQGLPQQLQQQQQQVLVLPQQQQQQQQVLVLPQQQQPRVLPQQQQVLVLPPQQQQPQVLPQQQQVLLLPPPQQQAFIMSQQQQLQVLPHAQTSPFAMLPEHAPASNYSTSYGLVDPAGHACLPSGMSPPAEAPLFYSTPGLLGPVVSGPQGSLVAVPCSGSILLQRPGSLANSTALDAVVEMLPGLQVSASGGMPAAQMQPQLQQPQLQQPLAAIASSSSSRAPARRCYSFNAAGLSSTAAAGTSMGPNLQPGMSMQSLLQPAVTSTENSVGPDWASLSVAEQQSLLSILTAAESEGEQKPLQQQNLLSALTAAESAGGPNLGTQQNQLQTTIDKLTVMKQLLQLKQQHKIQQCMLQLQQQEQEQALQQQLL